MGLIVIALLVVIVAAAVGFFVPVMNDSNNSPSFGGGVAGLVVGGIIGLVILGYGSYHPLDPGHVGIIKGPSGSINGTLNHGGFVAPWNSVSDVDIKTTHKQFDNLSVPSRESQGFTVTATLNYNVTEAQVKNLYTNVGSKFYDTLIEPRVFNDLKDETVKYAAVDLLPNREQIRRDVSAHLNADLGKYGITVTDFLLKEILPPEGLKNSILAKLKAQQNALAAQTQVSVVQAQARQKVAQAEGEANAAVTAAKGEKQAAIQKAQGVAESNRLIASSLRNNPRLLDYIRAQAAADAVKNLAASAQTIVVPPNTLFGQGIFPKP